MDRYERFITKMEIYYNEEETTNLINSLPLIYHSFSLISVNFYENANLPDKHRLKKSSVIIFEMDEADTKKYRKMINIYDDDEYKSGLRKDKLKHIIEKSKK